MHFCVVWCLPMMLSRHPLLQHIHKLYSLVTCTQQGLTPYSSHLEDLSVGYRGAGEEEDQGSCLKMSSKKFPANEKKIVPQLLLRNYVKVMDSLEFYFLRKTSFQFEVNFFTTWIPTICSIVVLFFLSLLSPNLYFLLHKISHPLSAIQFSVL